VFVNRNTLIVGALLATACNVEDKPDSASGEDWEQAGALELYLDKLTDDYLDFEEGDSTDWKYFKIKNRGLLELTVYWDNKHVSSTINVRDRFRVLQQSRAHSSELEKDRIDMRVEPGTYFVEFSTTKGASVYTVEAAFQAFDYAPSDDVAPEAIPLGGDLLGEPLPDPEPIAERPRRRARRGTKRRAPKARSRKSVGATITRIVKKKRGSVIYLNRGKDDGLYVEQKGQIMAGGKHLRDGQVIIRRVRARSAEAVTNASPGRIADNRRVLLWVQ